MSKIYSYKFNIKKYCKKLKIKIIVHQLKRINDKYKIIMDIDYVNNKI